MMRLLSFPLIWDDSMVYYDINTLLCNFCSCVQFLLLEIVYIVCLHAWDQCLGCSGKLAVSIQLQLWKYSRVLAPGCRDLWEKSMAGGRTRNNSEIKQPPPDQPSTPGRFSTHLFGNNELQQWYWNYNFLIHFFSIVFWFCEELND